MNAGQASKRIERFFAQFGEGHRALALQAAFPVALTPDLLYRLWFNFQRDATPARAFLDMPWIAVADLLLSNLCEEAGYELYEMVPEVRADLLARLTAEPRLGPARILELARFTREYVSRQLDLKKVDFARVQHLNALAYLEPQEALQQMLDAYQRIGSSGGEELLRLAALVERIAAPAQAAAATEAGGATAAGFDQLKNLTQGLSIWVEGDAETARKQLEKFFGKDVQIEIGGKRLDLPAGFEQPLEPAGPETFDNGPTGPETFDNGPAGPETLETGPTGPRPLLFSEMVTISVLGPNQVAFGVVALDGDATTLVVDTRWPGWLDLNENLARLPADPQRAGAELFNALLPGGAGQRFQEMYERARRAGEILPVQIQAERAKLPSSLTSLPWELLNFSPSGASEPVWLAADPDTILTRRPDRDQPAPRLELAPSEKLRLASLVYDLDSRPSANLSFQTLLGATWIAQQAQIETSAAGDYAGLAELARFRPHILHLSCPAVTRSNRAQIGLPGPDSQINWAFPEALLNLLGGWQPALVVIHTSPGRSDPAAGLGFAAELAQNRPFSTLAAQFADPIAALVFFEQFYSGLISGLAAGQALQAACREYFGQQGGIKAVYEVPALFSSAPYQALFNRPGPEKAAEALAAARELEDPAARAKALAELVPALAPEQAGQALEAALQAAEGIRDPSARADVLIALAAHLPPSLAGELRQQVQEQALAAARSLSGEVERARALLELAPTLDPEPGERAREEAFAGVMAIEDEFRRGQALVELAPILEVGWRRTALEEVLGLNQPEQRAELLVRMLPALDPEEQALALKEAENAAGRIRDPQTRFELLAKVAAALPEGGDRVQVFSQAYRAALEITFNEETRARAMLILLPLGDKDDRRDLVNETLQAAVQMDLAPARAEVLAGLAPWLLPGREQERALAAALAISEESERAAALAGLAPVLEGEALRQAAEAAGQLSDPAARPQALAALDRRLKGAPAPAPAGEEVPLPGESRVDFLLRRLQAGAPGAAPADRPFFARAIADLEALQKSQVQISSTLGRWPGQFLGQPAAGPAGWFGLVLDAALLYTPPVEVERIDFELELQGQPGAPASASKGRPEGPDISLESLFPPEKWQPPPDLNPDRPSRLALEDGRDWVILPGGSPQGLDLADFNWQGRESRVLAAGGMLKPLESGPLQAVRWQIGQTPGGEANRFTFGLLFSARPATEKLSVQVQVAILPPPGWLGRGLPPESALGPLLAPNPADPLRVELTLFLQKDLPPGREEPAEKTAREELLVYAAADRLALRTAPQTSAAIIDRLPLAAGLLVLDPPDLARSRIGAPGQWLHVRTRAEAGGGGRPRPVVEGYVDGGFVSLNPPDEADPTPPGANQRTYPPPPPPVEELHTASKKPGPRAASIRLEPVLSQVMLIAYNPPAAQDSRAGTYAPPPSQSEVLQLTSQLAEELAELSRGYARFQVVDAAVQNQLPVLKDGFRYDPASYQAALADPGKAHQPFEADYQSILKEFDLVRRINSRSLDEVWLFGPPLSGFYESRMAGPKAFFVNAPPLDARSGLKRSFMWMGFNSQRGLAEMLECFGHRAEFIMKFKPNTARGVIAVGRFFYVEKTNPGQAQVGTMHLAPNSREDFDFGNPAEVLSGCDAWLDYPDLNAPPRPVTSAEWGGGDILEHHRWWFRHLPSFTGEVNKLSNNWWEYILDPAQDGLKPFTPA